MISNIYRAKREDTGTWVTGTLKFNGFLVSIISESTHKEYLIDKDTICKRLDIKDRYNNWIYEGDFVKTNQRKANLKYALVFWDNEYLCWRFSFNTKSIKPRVLREYYKPLLEASKSHLYEVIGNKYDNEDLCGD